MNRFAGRRTGRAKHAIARIAEAEREGWPGEVEGLKIRPRRAGDKLAQIGRRTQASAPVSTGMPGLPDAAAPSMELS